MAGRNRKVLPRRAGKKVPKGEAVQRYKALPRVDIITAGVPCQDVSVAGKRAGLQGSRTGLFYEFARILRELRPRWFVFENVPGLLSSNQGRDFAEVLRVLMVECGYGVQWRVLDSRYFGVAQRRRRVFIVGRFGEPCPAEILFEPESRRRNLAPGGETRADLAQPIVGRIGKGGFTDPVNDNLVAARLTTRPYSDSGDDQHNLVAAPLRAQDGGSKGGGPRGGSGENLVSTLRSQNGSHGFSIKGDGDETHIVIQDARGQREKRQHGIGIFEGGPSYTLSQVDRHAVAALFQTDGGYSVDKACAGNYVSSQINPDRVRNFARLPKGLDSPRYRALGNAVTVQVAEWIAKRIVNYVRHHPEP